MAPKICRTLLIESINLSDQCLSSIGESLSKTLYLAINRVTDKPTITHFTSYLVDTQPTQISRLLALKAAEFPIDCIQKLSHLKRSPKQLLTTEDNCLILTNILKDVKQSLDRTQEIRKTELTYISGRDIEEVVDDFTFAFEEQRIDSSFISQINIAVIKTRAEPNVVFGAMNLNLTGIPDELRTLLEIQTIDSNETTIEGYFKVWLYDFTTDYEKIRIYLSKEQIREQMNGHINGEDINGNNDFVIKCDIREAIIDLNRLAVDKSGKKQNSLQIDAKHYLLNICETMNFYELQALGLINRFGVCESLLFGIPYILSATRSSDLEFTDLDLNSQRFHALVHELNERNAIIILKERQRSDYLQRLFAVLPSSDTNTMILKSIATKELVLPHFVDSYEQMMSKTPTQPVVDSIRSQLSCIQLVDIYNPLRVETNLFDIFKNN